MRMIIAGKIRELREDNEVKQDELAKLLNIGQSSYSKYERGIVNIPIENLSVIANYFNTSLDYLAGRTNTKDPYPRA